MKLKGKNQEFCLTAFMPGRSLVRRACPTRDTSTTRGSTPCLAFALSAYALKSRIALTVERPTVSGHSGDLLELQICPLNGYCE